MNNQPIGSVRISGPRCTRPLGPLDPRENAWRDDLADIALAGKLTVPHYAKPVVLKIRRQTPLLVADKADAAAASEMLPGEEFAMLDSGHGYAWGFGLRDHYVGHVALDALGMAGETIGEAGMIGPGDALLFVAPTVKSPVHSTIPAASLVRWLPHDDRFVALQGEYAGMFLHRRHLLAADGDRSADWVEMALQFRGAPYRWGGRTRAGVDCSGLIQVARQLVGHRCRRDSDMQFADAAQDVAPTDIKRGDIAYWPGHIGILLGDGNLLHANAHWMSCVIEPLADVIARTAENGQVVEPKIRRVATPVCNSR